MLTVNISLMADKSVLPIITLLFDKLVISVPYNTVYVSVSLTILCTIHEMLAEYGAVITLVIMGTRGGDVAT